MAVAADSAALEASVHGESGSFPTSQFVGDVDEGRAAVRRLLPTLHHQRVHLRRAILGQREEQMGEISMSLSHNEYGFEGQS